jgi:hypothetical protein
MSNSAHNGKDVHSIVQQAVARHGASSEGLIPVLSEVNQAARQTRDPVLRERALPCRRWAGSVAGPAKRTAAQAGRDQQGWTLDSGDHQLPGSMCRGPGGDHR